MPWPKQALHHGQGGGAACELQRSHALAVQAGNTRAVIAGSGAPRKIQREREREREKAPTTTNVVFNPLVLKRT